MIQRIFCLSDTHGYPPPHFDADGVIAILHGGDFYDGRILRYAAGRDPSADGLTELRRVTDLAWMDQAAAPIFAVKGNHDVADPLGVFNRATDITCRVVEIAPHLLVAGIGWKGERFYDLPTEADMQEACDAVRNELNRRTLKDRVILLTHYPGRFPELFQSKGMPNAWWYASVRQFIADTKPLLVIQGHLHEHAGTSGNHPELGAECLIVNPGAAGMLVELNDSISTLRNM